MKKLWFPLYTLVLSCNKLSQNSWKASNFIPQFAIIQNLQRSLLLFTIHRQPWYWNGTTALVGLGLRPISACVIEWGFLGPLVTRRAFTLLPSYLESKLQGRPFWKTIKRSEGCGMVACIAAWLWLCSINFGYTYKIRMIFE